jgi:hypothetical protein
LDRPSNQSSIKVENSIMGAFEVRGSNLHPERNILTLLNPELPAQVLHLMDTVGEEVLEEHKKNLDPSWPVPLYTTTINSCQSMCLLQLSLTKPNLLTQLCTETNRLKALLNHVNNSNKRQKRNVGVYDEVMNIQTNTPKTQYNAHLFNSRQILQQNRICGSCSKRVLQCTDYEWLNAADKEAAAKALPTIQELSTTPCECGNSCVFDIHVQTLSWIRERYLQQQNRADKALIMDTVLGAYAICFTIASLWVPMGRLEYINSINRAKNGEAVRSRMIDYRLNNPSSNKTTNAVIDAVHAHLEANTNNNPEKRVVRPIHYEKNSKKALHRDFKKVSGIDLPFSTWKRTMGDLFSEEQVKFLRLSKDHNKCPYCLYMEELTRSLAIELKTTTDEEKRKDLLHQSIINQQDYEKHIDRDIDMRKLAHYFQDKSILYELGQQRCYDEQSDFLNWSYYSKIQSIVIQAIKDVWTALVQPAQNMEACYIPTVADTKQIISTTLYDIITDGCKPGECERIGLSPALFFDQMFHH